MKNCVFLLIYLFPQTIEGRKNKIYEYFKTDPPVSLLVRLTKIDAQTTTTKKPPASSEWEIITEILTEKIKKKTEIETIEETKKREGGTVPKKTIEIGNDNMHA
uniref:Uncharacterized protein n=1 Tax=Schistosoma haematobium TaxID=6185 RepID=A0A095C9E9_SCHHA